MKVLFLDVDGVLVIDGPDYGVERAHFSDRALQQLARIVRSTSARIVLHSSWRYHGDKKLLLNQTLTEFGIAPIYSQTKHTYLWEVGHKPLQIVRTDEILAWLSGRAGSGPCALQYGREELAPTLPVARHLKMAIERCALPPPDRTDPHAAVERWAVLDDCALELDGRLGARFVRTDEHLGLTSAEADEAIWILGEEDPDAAGAAADTGSPAM